MALPLQAVRPLPTLPRRPRETALRPVPTGASALETALDDVRVAAVLAVLRGATVESTALEKAVDPALLQRWVAAFITAGVATVVQRPDPLRALRNERLLDAASAEIREPLVRALESARRLTERCDVPDTSRAQLGLLSRALDQLDERVGDANLLVSTALDGVKVERRRVTLGSLTAPLAGVGTVHGKGLDYELDVDPDLFGRVLRDVWAAAARPPQPRLRRMWVRCVGPWVELRVLRPGDPLDVDLLHALFEPFEHDRDDTGVSVGLYLARALTVAHGGTLGVDQDDSGAAFWVRVPAASAAVGTDPSPAPVPVHRSPHGDRAIPSRGALPMSTFRLACGDVMPGCHARFEAASQDALLGQVATHAAADHGIREITPDVLALVQSKIQAA